MVLYPKAKFQVPPTRVPMVLLSRERFQSVAIDYHHIERIAHQRVEEAAVAPFGQKIHAR